jgi:hypothetical protein
MIKRPIMTNVLSGIRTGKSEKSSDKALGRLTGKFANIMTK